MKENTVGAPTEGLGQTVTFAFDPRSGVPQMSAPGAAQVQGGVRGPGVQALPNVTPAQQVENATVQLLLKAGDAVIGERIQKKRVEQFVSGMQRAMAGAAVDDIVKEQPWYAGVFGDAAVVEGARFFAQHANVTNTVATLEEAMPKLRQMPAAEAAKFTAEAINGSLTGDKVTDMAILRSYTQVTPGFLRRQTKEHYAWKQEQAATAQSQAISAAASRLNKAAIAGYGTGMMTDEEYTGLSNQLLDLTRIPDGADVKSWQARQTNDILAMAQRGEMHAVTALRRAGILEHLAPEQATRVGASIEMAEAKMSRRMSAEYGTRMAEIMATAHAMPVDANGKPTVVPEDIANQIDALNKEAMRKYGTSVGPFTPDERTQILRGSMGVVLSSEAAHIRKAREAAEKTGNVELAQEQTDAAVMRAYETGGLKRLGAEKGMSPEINRTLTRVWSSLKDPKARAAFLDKVASNGWELSSVEGEIVGTVHNALRAEAKDMGTLAPVYEQWLALHNQNPALPAKFFGAYSNRMRRFHTLYEGTRGNLAAAASVFSDNEPRESLNKATILAATAGASKAYEGFLPGWVPLLSKKLRAGQEDVVATLFGGDIETTAAVYGGDLTTATKLVLDRGQRDRKVELVGGYAITGIRGEIPLAAYLTRPSQVGGVARVPFGAGGDDVDDAVGAAVDRVLYGDGKKAGLIPQASLLPTRAQHTRIWRVPSPDGVPRLLIHAVADGKPYTDIISAAALFEARDDAKNAAQEAAADNLGRRGGTSNSLRRNAYVAPGN